VAGLDQGVMEVVAAFQRFVKTQTLGEIDKYNLADLQQVDAALGNRDLNAGFRIAMRQRIADMQMSGERKHQSWVRIVGYAVAFAVGVLATLTAQWLTK